MVAGYPIVRDVSDPVRTWTATTPTGAPLPPGSYTLVSHVVDSYGNNGTLAQELHRDPLHLGMTHGGCLAYGAPGGRMMKRTGPSRGGCDRRTHPRSSRR